MSRREHQRRLRSAERAEQRAQQQQQAKLFNPVLKGNAAGWGVASGGIWLKPALPYRQPWYAGQRKGKR